MRVVAALFEHDELCVSQINEVAWLQPEIGNA
jgi:hypothetical protein